MPSLALLQLASLGFAISAFSVKAEEKIHSPPDEDFWYWLESYSDANGQVFDPVDFSEITQMSDSSTNAPTDSRPTENLDIKTEKILQKHEESPTREIQ